MNEPSGQKGSFMPLVVSDDGDGGILNIDPVSISIDKDGIRAFVNAVEEIES